MYNCCWAKTFQELDKIFLELEDFSVQNVHIRASVTLSKYLSIKISSGRFTATRS